MFLINLVFAKKYERCELARELQEKHYLKLDDVGMLVCIAEKISDLDTSTLKSAAHGLFQVCFNFINCIIKYTLM